MTLRRIALVFAVGAVLLRGQACPQLGLNTVEEAENQFFNNRKVETQKLLEKAYTQCRRDGPVIRRIAEVYRLIGSDSESDHYSKLANDLGAAQNLRITAQIEEPTQPAGLVHQKFALVVGVSQFEDFAARNKIFKADEPLFRRIPDLLFAAKDAKDFAGALMLPDTGHFQKDRVELLVNAEVTADRVRRAVARIEQEANEDDLVVLFFSSHGSSPEMDPAASDAKSGFILMHDTEYRNVLNTATAYPMYELVNAIKRFRAKRVVAFMDTCYSGDTVVVKGSRSFGGEPAGSKGMTTGLAEADQIIRATPQDRARVVITSSGANERSWESESSEGGNGYFTKYLLEAMKKEQGQATISQIYRYINDNVPAAVYREKNGAPQHPQLRAYPNPKQEINVVIGAPETEGGLR